jgi:transposase
VALVDALGNLARFILLPGQRHDTVGVEPLLDGIALEALIGDKAFDSDWLRAELNERGALAVIPANGSRAGTIPYDEEMYKWRHLVENLFQKIKEFRRIATRYDKTDTSFRAAIHLVASFLALK